MISEVFITCAVTGGGDAPRQKNVPVTPEQIADSAIEAARAGAAAVHLHVRDLTTQEGSLDPALWRSVVQRIRQSDVNPVLNLTTGEGCGIVVGGPEAPLPLATGTWMASLRERLVHIEELRPEICTLDCGSKSSKGNVEGVMVNTVGMLRAMAARCKEIGVKPELEVFDTGHVVLANDLVKEGLVDGVPLYQLCMGTGNGAPPDVSTLMAMVNLLPPDAVYSAFSVGPMQLPYAALSPLVGANIRVGLEDNLYLSRGRLATNSELVRRAVEILERMGVRVMSPDQMRDKLKLKVHA
ncbi:3-keto-5-aminohexanoate cleavage protein [Bradyrhizobium cajani]|uniref:3-keto-5-aminohexanoate cleavage protein n=1 Tax=Bradyrhizobium cajani TaxID=1928661 RepID=A0A844TPD5_9BRAD|nr:3-keto-5-aminohexanoate cleavage protein [Bradyrhizobium cajani]MCP3371779.1 3-keto-5-aminohexanoate cleavage protein [Bradyrhizobium cajani]MVT76400.1 3-keto-5-aminohexanoate cleavage protein [Bradyrhizobium cajani]